MYSSQTLKALTAQFIVNNDITTEEIPIHLEEEMYALKKVLYIQQFIKYEEGVDDLLIRLLDHLNDYISFADSNYIELTEIGLDVDKYVKYFKECKKWFSIVYFKIINIILNKEDELEVIQNSLPLEYHNISFKFIQIVNEDDDRICEYINKIIENLIDQKYKITESARIELYEDLQRKWGHHPSQQAYLKNMFDSITQDRKYAMTVLKYYNLYFLNKI